MLIESRITKLIENTRRLQSMVQEMNGVTSSEIIRSRELLKECEAQIASLFKLEPPEPEGRVVDGNTKEELNSKITSIALESERIFRIATALPISKDVKIHSIKNREDNRLAKNRFTGKLCHIRAELIGTKLIYVVQYATGHYGLVTEENLEII